MIDENEFFREVTLRITSSLEIGDALASLRDYIARYIPITSIHLSYFQEDGGGGGLHSAAFVGSEGAAKSFTKAGGALPRDIPGDPGGDRPGTGVLYRGKGELF